MDKNLNEAYALVTLPEVVQATYYYNNGITDKTKLSVKELSGSEKIDRIFDITIKIYESGAAANQFPEEERLTTVTGSKNN